jgi:hypothetical protein
VHHEGLLKFLRQRIGDARVLRLLYRMLGDFRKSSYSDRVGMFRCSSRNANSNSLREVRSCPCPMPCWTACRCPVHHKLPICA